MSTGEPISASENSPASRRFPGSLPPTTRMMLLTWGIVCLAGYALYQITSQQSAEIRQGLSATQSTLSDLDQRLRAGDSSAITEIETMRKRVEEFDRTLATQRDQFRQLSDRADEVKSRKAVERAKTAVLLAEVTTARGRLQKIKSLHASWTARSGSLMSGDSGRKIVASPPHFAILTGILDREQLTDADLQKWELQLESLAGPVEASRDSDVTVTAEHTTLLNELGSALTTAVTKLDQQSLLLDAIIRETTNVRPTEVTLEQALLDRQTQAEFQRAKTLAQAREDARLAAEKAQAERLAQLEREVVAAEGKVQEESLEAKKAQAAKLGQLEREKIAEETKAKEAEKRAEIAGIKAKTNEVDAEIKAAALEREFQRDLPEIKSLLSAFLTGGFKYRNDNAKGPASLSHIASQKGLESTANGSYAMAFLANSSDRPAGGLKNPASPERIRRAQDLLNKYGDLMVQKKMLEP